ncbi:uncharacterized protein LOC143293055 isoform X2 [Babylonia areolata]|uniref:uncharacterized protein LOC143293055 isoform X2 n=1 Tax=Babylonia areolata TaxID=304850 RepID=UPI003FCF2739
MASKIKALQQWCHRMTDGYRDVHVKDFTTSWRNGLAFCAIIHRFRPDLIDYDSLSKENVFDNNHLAFTVAEQELDIPAFLEAADMVALRTPDKLSVITYVSQYYNKLCNLPQLGGPGVQGKKSTTAAATAAPAHGTKRHQPAEPLSEPEPKKQPPAKKDAESTAKVKTLGDRCAICNNKVYLLERHVEDGKLYHRSCFRHSDLSPTNKVYTRSPFFSPKLHGNDTAAASPVKSSSSEDNGHSGAFGKTLGTTDKHGTKRTTDDDGKKSEVRKFLFSKDTDAKKKSDDDKVSTKVLERGRGDVSNNKQLQPDRSTPTSHTHSSMDFLSGSQDVNDVKSQKRQLPLIFQAAGSAEEGTSDKTKNGALDKTSLFSRNKPASDSKGVEKSSTPVAKPRQSGVKVLTSTPEPKQEKEKFLPKASPRTSVLSADMGQRAASDQTKSPTALRRVPDRTKSPVRESSPPPLPSSAPPPMLNASSPRPSPRKSAALSASQGEASHKSSSSVLLSTQSNNSAHSKPSPLVTTSSSGSTSQSKTGNELLSTFGTKTSGMRVEEPMEVETAFSKARSQYREEPVAVMVVPSDTAKDQQDKTALTGLLKSLAKVRNTNSSASSAITASSHTSTPTSTSVSRPAVSESSPAGLVSSKVSLGHTAGGDQKSKLSSVDKNEGKKGKMSQTDGLLSESKGKSPFSFLKTGDTSNKSAESEKKTPSVSSNVSSDKPVPVTKLGETVTITLNTGKGKNEASIPVSLASTPKQNEKPSERVPLFKKKGDNKLANRRDRSNDSPRDTTGVSLRAGGAVGTNKERPKSAADIFGRKELSTPKQSSSSTEASQPPPFTQVRLRDSSNSAQDRKERAKSAGNIFDSDMDSKPSWQQEAQRKMAKYRDNGFVDPETKKTLGKSDETAKTVDSEAKKTVGKSTETAKTVDSDKKAVGKSTETAKTVDSDKKTVGKSAETVKTMDVSTKAVEKAGFQKKEKSPKKHPPPRPPPVHTPVSGAGQKEKASRAKSPEAKKKGKDDRTSVFQQDSSPSPSHQPSPEGAAAGEKKKERRPSLMGQLKGILKSGNKDTAETEPPPKPERQLRTDDTTQPEAMEAQKTTDSVKQGEVTGAKKKIAVGGLKDPNQHSPLSSPPHTPRSSKPPALPSEPPPSSGRKRITVDIDFDFDKSSSLEVSYQPKWPAPGKATPPSRPPPPHKTSMSPGRMSAIELQQQLLNIDSKLSELELRGRQLEDSIRSVAAEEEDDLMIEWFQLVTEKNELVRKECDLVYMSREQDLEDEQSQIESQLHYLLTKDESDKSFEEKEEEEYLIQRKVAIVNQRNSIVESIDEDRIRYEEEDRDIAQMLQEKGLKKDAEREKQVGSSKFYM